MDALNSAQEQRAAARAELEGTPAPHALTEAEIHAMVDSLENVGRGLNRADPAQLEDLYGSLRLEMVFDASERAVEVTISPGRDSARVRGRSCALFTRLQLPCMY